MIYQKPDALTLTKGKNAGDNEVYLKGALFI